MIVVQYAVYLLLGLIAALNVNWQINKDKPDKGILIRKYSLISYILIVLLTGLQIVNSKNIKSLNTEISYKEDFIKGFYDALHKDSSEYFPQTGITNLKESNNVNNRGQVGLMITGGHPTVSDNVFMSVQQIDSLTDPNMNKKHKQKIQ
jgi:hypothetical protein